MLRQSPQCCGRNTFQQICPGGNVMDLPSFPFGINKVLIHLAIYFYPLLTPCTPLMPFYCSDDTTTRIQSRFSVKSFPHMNREALFTLLWFQMANWKSPVLFLWLTQIWQQQLFILQAHADQKVSPTLTTVAGNAWSNFTESTSSKMIMRRKQKLTQSEKWTKQMCVRVCVWTSLVVNTVREFSKIYNLQPIRGNKEITVKKLEWWPAFQTNKSLHFPKTVKPIKRHRHPENFIISFKMWLWENLRRQQLYRSVRENHFKLLQIFGL